MLTKQIQTFTVKKPFPTDPFVVFLGEDSKVLYFATNKSLYKFGEGKWETSQPTASVVLESSNSQPLFGNLDERSTLIFPFLVLGTKSSLQVWEIDKTLTKAKLLFQHFLKDIETFTKISLEENSFLVARTMSTLFAWDLSGILFFFPFSFSFT